MRKLRKIVLGSRASRLAVIQAEEVKNELKKLYPEFQFEIKKIKTTADRKKDLSYKAIDSRDIFTKQIDEALLKGKIDLAVHSTKDVPISLPEGLLIAAVTERRSPQDVLIARGGIGLGQLSKGARVGTSSIRRRAQLLRVRPDLEIVEIRGNLDTRIKKLYGSESELDAIVVAKAGLERLNYKDSKFETLNSDVMLPAPGQGSLAIEIRANDGQMVEMASRLNHEDSSFAVQAERAFLKALGGGCRVPIAALGEVGDGQLNLEGIVLSFDGKKAVRWQVSGQMQQASKLGNELAESLLSQGAQNLLS